MTEFAPRPVDVNGMSLSQYADGVSMQAVADRFSLGLMEGYSDSEKGYDGLEVGFVHLPTGTEFYVYARWGQVRVGCRRDDRRDADNLAEELAQYIQQTVAN